MAYSALFDSCVLYPPTLRDLLLRLGERGLFRPLWSGEILDEMVRSVIRGNPHLEPIDLSRTVELMRQFFPDAEVQGYEGLVAAMNNDEKDRHVLAAAVKGGADVVVTQNVRHFPQEAIDPYDLDVQSPDEFLLHQFYLCPDIVAAELEAIAADYRNPPMSVGELLDRLAKVTPEFSDTLRTFLRG